MYLFENTHKMTIPQVSDQYYSVVVVFHITTIFTIEALESKSCSFP